MLVVGTTALAAGLLGCSNASDVARSGSSTEPTPLATDDDPVEPVPLIPLPAKVAWGDGHLLIPDAGAPPSSAVSISSGAEELGDEGYKLDISQDGIQIVAAGDAGVFYAKQTLAQLGGAPDQVGAGAQRLPFVSITDSPRFEWRGYMLDVSRHFFDIGVVKKQIDVLSSYKVNRLHLHLTDDQGWRIEIPSMPGLTELGASIDFSGEGPGGFFTTEQYQQIVDYAAAHFMTLVPEIDVPGHTNAALASYGNLNDDGVPTQLEGVVPFGQSALSMQASGSPKFLSEVFTELARMTPGPYIHIGGDEALSLDHDEYSELVALAADAVVASGKTSVAWEEAATAAVPESLIAQYWNNTDVAHQAARSGHQLIVSPAKHAYLDMKYDEDTAIGVNWAGFVDLESAYAWDPTDEGFPEDTILGVEAPLWTETIETPSQVDYMTYPRMLGYAEIGWTPQAERNWPNYRSRLAAYGPRLSEAGVGFYASPAVDWDQ